MYPIIPPGSFLQVDESRRRVVNSGWRSEFERPVYFVETRDYGFHVGWCSLFDNVLTLHPHPLSPARIKSYRNGQDAEVIGQVVAIAVQLPEMENQEPPAPVKKKP